MTAIEVKAFIVYYRELAACARDSIAGLPGLSEAMSIKITVGAHSRELVDCPLHAGEHKEFAETILLGIERFCLQRAQELETKLPAVVCR